MSHNPAHKWSTNYRRGCRCPGCVESRNAYMRRLYREGRRTWRGPELIEEALMLWRAGETPERLAQRLGVTIAAVQRAFQRHGHPIPWPEVNPYRRPRGLSTASPQP